MVKPLERRHEVRRSDPPPIGPLSVHWAPGVVPPPPPRAPIGRWIAIVAVVLAAAGGVVAWQAWPSDRSKAHPAAKVTHSHSATTQQSVMASETPAVAPEVQQTCTGLDCRFEVTNADALGGQPLTWDFGDGKSVVATGTVSHTYAKAGSYTARAATQLPSGEPGLPTDVDVNIASWKRTAQLHAGPAGSRKISATIGGPSGCRSGTYELVTATSPASVVRKGTIKGSSLKFTVPSYGGYRLKLDSVNGSGGVCPAVVSGVVQAKAAPVPVYVPPPSPVYVPPQPVYTPPPGPSHYTPPPIH